MEIDVFVPKSNCSNSTQTIICQLISHGSVYRPRRTDSHTRLQLLISRTFNPLQLPFNLCLSNYQGRFRILL